MKIILGFAMRTPLATGLGKSTEESCRLCEGCVGSILVKSPLQVFTHTFDTFADSTYECGKFPDAVVDLYTSEDPDMPCSRFKPFKYKKL